jgi:hypothetical protein
MAQDKNTLLGLLAVARGWAQPSEVLAAHQALAVDPRRTLAKELSLSPDRELELEEAAQESLEAANGNISRALAALKVPSGPPRAAAFDEGDETTSMEVSPLKSIK